MLHVYAIEPEALARFNSVWQALNSFGFDEGRLVARFPKSWFARVYAATDGCSTLERKRIEFGLQRLKPHVVKSKARFEGESWRDNARRECAHFRGIIQIDNPNSDEFVMTPLELCDDHKCWPVQRGAAVARTPNAIADVLENIMEYSSELHFVDRYYDGGRDRNNVIGECLDRIRTKNMSCERIVIHTAVAATPAHIEAGARWLLNKLPNGVDLRVRVWQQVDGCEGFHARYLMSENAGVRVDWGFSEGEPGTTTDVELMSGTLHKQRWQQFQQQSSPYRLEHDIAIV